VKIGEKKEGVNEIKNGIRKTLKKEREWDDRQNSRKKEGASMPESVNV